MLTTSFFLCVCLQMIARLPVHTFVAIMSQEGASDYVNPNPPKHERAPLTRLAQPDMSSPVTLTMARARHSDEVFSRLRWCLDNGYLPAHDHVHLAPGDDKNFMVRP